MKSQIGTHPPTYEQPILYHSGLDIGSLVTRPAPWIICPSALGKSRVPGHGAAPVPPAAVLHRFLRHARAARRMEVEHLRRWVRHPQGGRAGRRAALRGMKNGDETAGNVGKTG